MNDASPFPELMRPGEPQAGGAQSVTSLSHRRQRLTASRVAAHSAALQEGLRLYKAMFERSALGQLIVDFPTFRIDVVNRSFCAMTGFKVDELVGSDYSFVYPAGRSPP